MVKELIKKKDGVLAEPLVKPERRKTSLYRRARADLDRRTLRRSRVSRRRGRRR